MAQSPDLIASKLFENISSIPISNPELPEQTELAVSSIDASFSHKCERVPSLDGLKSLEDIPIGNISTNNLPSPLGNQLSVKTSLENGNATPVPNTSGTMKLGQKLLGSNNQSRVSFQQNQNNKTPQFNSKKIIRQNPEGIKIDTNNLPNLSEQIGSGASITKQESKIANYNIMGLSINSSTLYFALVIVIISAILFFLTMPKNIF